MPPDDQRLALPAAPAAGAPRRWRCALPWAAWPAADRAAWRRACAPVSLLDDTGGRAATWRPSSREAVRGAYGHWLGFLERCGERATLADPAGLVTPARVEAYYRDLLDGPRSSVTVGHHIARLGMAATALYPEQDWAWLRAMGIRARRRSRPARSKAGRLVSPRTLLDLGETLMAEAAAMPPERALAAAMLHRDGLLIALLATLPLRRRNLMSLELEHRLTRHPHGWVIAIPSEETKNHRPLDLAFPEALIPALETHLSRHRRVLLARRRTGATAGLWLSQAGTPLADLRAWQIVTTHTRRRLGIAVNPHLFRDCAATFLGSVDPEHVRMAAPLLGHSNYATTERHYILAQSGHALARHHDAILARRKRAAPT